MSGPKIRISKDIVPGHLLAILRAKIRQGRWAVRVGLPDSESADGLTLAQLGSIQEYGTSTIPPRPFLETGVRLARERIRETSRALLVSIVKGRRTIEEGLEVIGAMAVAATQKAIADGMYFVPNADATIARKKSSKPLIDTGRMRQAITQVVTGKES
jgi:hypothetical protein